MAKHPHKLILLNKKTWRCILNGCSFFVHLGLTHVLVGKSAICWSCEEMFIVHEISLKEDKPRCDDCRLASVVESVPVFPDDPSQDEMTPEKIKLYKELGLIK